MTPASPLPVAALGLLAFSALALPSARSVEAGAFWSFQPATNTAGSNLDLGANPSFSSSISTFVGAASLATTSSAHLRSFAGSALTTNYLDFQATSWSPGTNLAWDGNTTGNSLTLSLDTTGFADLALRFDYRMTSGGGAAFDAFEYRVGGSGDFTTLTSVPVIANNSVWSVWSYDLSSIAALSNTTQVELRWVLPDIASGISFRMDNFELTASSVIPEPSSYAALFGLAVLGFAAFRTRRAR